MSTISDRTISTVRYFIKLWVLTEDCTSGLISVAVADIIATLLECAAGRAMHPNGRFQLIRAFERTEAAITARRDPGNLVIFPPMNWRTSPLLRCNAFIDWETCALLTELFSPEILPWWFGWTG